MVKLAVILISLAVGGYLGYFFDGSIHNIFLDILVGVGFALAAFLVQVVMFFVILFFLTFSENKNKERKYQSHYFRHVMLILDSFLFSLFSMKNHCSGREHLSTSQQYIFVGNHRSNLDSLVMDYYLRNYPLVFIAKDSLFKIPFVGKGIHGCAYLKLIRGNIQEEFKTFALAHEMLTREDRPLSVGVFPEGTRNKSNDSCNVQEFKPGTFRMALKSQKPIVITALRGTKEVNNNLLFRRHHVYFDVLEVLDYEQYKEMDVNQIASYCQNKIATFLKENTK